VIIFLAALCVIELKRQGLFPGQIGALVPAKHFYAIQVAFGALLLYEVIGLVFSLARSIANALGHQLEILSLILLRGSFEELIHFDEPVQWERFSGTFVGNPILHLIANAVGALAVFILLDLYYGMQKHQPISDDAHDREAFVTAKKSVGLGLLAGYVLIGLAMTAPPYITVLIGVAAAAFAVALTLAYNAFAPIARGGEADLGGE
jgi:hypothetical protein